MAPLAQPSAIALLGPLEAYDLSLWLGSEQAAAQALAVSQSTVSRGCTRLQRALQLPHPRELRRHPQRLPTTDPALLRGLRQIHQQVRLTDRRGLRFQCDQPLSSDQQQALQHQGWLLGGRGLWRPEQISLLLQEAVLDIWLPLESSALLTRRDLYAPEARSPTSQTLATLTQSLTHHVDLHPAERPLARLQ